MSGSGVVGTWAFGVDVKARVDFFVEGGGLEVTANLGKMDKTGDIFSKKLGPVVADLALDWVVLCPSVEPTSTKKYKDW